MVGETPMIISIAGIVFIVAVIALCGYSLTYFFANNAGTLFLAGCSFPIGAMYYIVFFIVINRPFAGPASHIPPLAALVAFAGIVSFAGGLKFPTSKTEPSPTGMCVSVLLFTAFFSCFRNFQELYADTAIHFQFSAEIALGKFPVALPGTFDVPFPYHSAYNILFGGIAALTGGNFIDVHIFISVLFVFSVTILLFSLINAVIPHGTFSAIGTFIVMLGTGLPGFIWHETGFYYRLLYMMQQHSWKFATFFVLLIMAAAMKRDSFDMKRFFILIIPLLPFAAYFSGQAVPFTYAGILALYLFGCCSYGNRISLFKPVMFALLLCVCAAVMLFIGGLFERPPAGTFASMHYSIQSVAGFFKIHEAHHGTAGRYYFFDTMFVLAGYIYVMAVVWKKIRAQGLASINWHERGAVLFLVGFGFLSYLSPLVLRYPVFFDNFCKFNYVGVITGMLCFVLMAYKFYVSGKYRRITTAVLAIYILCLFAIQTAFIFQESDIWEARADMERYKNMIHSVHGLNINEGFAVYGVPGHVSYRLGVNLLNPVPIGSDDPLEKYIDRYAYHPLNLYEYLPYDAVSDIERLSAKGLRYIVAANEAILQVEHSLPTEINRIDQGDDGLWAIYELPSSGLWLAGARR